VDEPDPGAGADDPSRDSPPFGPEDRHLSPGATAFMGLGISIALALGIPVGIGVLVDKWLHSSPWGILVGLVVGVFMAVMMAVATVRKYL
jgi:F0F1-type ATP synthase assembly protein I